MKQSSKLKRLKTLSLALPLTVAASSSAQAALHDRGGGLIYDDLLNVTWLQDANYAKTSGFDADGKMTYSQAYNWAASLVYTDTVRNTSWSDWRLATAHDLGALGADVSNNGTDAGYNASLASSELANLWYGTLGLKSPWTTANAFNANYGLWGNGSWNGTNRVGPRGQANINPFVNIQADNYWMEPTYALASSAAWYFSAFDGYQRAWDKSASMFAWAVRSGDVGAAPAPVVPIPGAAWLLGTGLLGMMSLNRRKPTA